MVISLSTYATKQDAFQGSWYSDGIVYSFDNDSLYIDELGNEGDVYIYEYIGGTINAINSLGDEFSFKIHKISPDEIEISNEAQLFTLNRIFNYDLENMRIKDKN